jgi:hypothetical protein
MNEARRRGQVEVSKSSESFVVSLIACLLIASAALSFAPGAKANVVPSAQLTLPTTTAAGAHSDQHLVIDLAYTDGSTESIKNLAVDLPAGALGNPRAVPEADRCTVDYTAATKDYSTCPVSSKVGTIAVSATIPVLVLSVPVVVNGTFYELKNRPASAPEVPAYLGLYIAPPAELPVGTLGINLTQKITVRTRADAGKDYGLRVITMEDIPNSLGVPLTIQKMDLLLNRKSPDGTNFLTNPTRCDGWTGKVYARSYGSNTNANQNVEGKDYAQVSTNTINPDCSDLAPYDPTVSFTTTSSKAGEPTGVSVVVHNSVTEPLEKYSSYHKSSDVVMPDGFEINPALGKDLGPFGCTAEEFNKEDPDTENTCPAGALVGTVTAQVPVLSTPLTGNVYLGAPGPNRADRYKMLIDAHGAISAKLEGRVTVADDGRISVKLGDPTVDTPLPQFPFSDFTLTFKSGPRAVVTNPLACGTHTGSVAITPWSGQAPAVRPMVSNISYDGNGAPCPGTQEFDPTFSMSPSTMPAGGHTETTFTFGRQDRQQLITQIDMSLPPGLVAAPNAATTCSDALANAGNCPASAAVGSIIAGIGSGPETLDLPGTLYNGVPAAGEPARLLIVVRELVGPYDLGTVVVPLDTRLRDDYGVDVSSGAIPQRLEGIPVRLRSAVVKLNASASNGPFMYAPSKCGSNEVTARILSDQGVTATRTASFTTTACDSLAFSPTLSLTPSDTNAGAPTGIDATIALPASPPQSTMKSVRVNMPAGYKINPAGADGLVACSDADADDQNCPAASKLGTATAASPLIATPLTGGLYAQASGSAPDGSDRYPLALVLKGTIDLTIRGRALVNETTGDVSIEFNNLPDLAVSSFNLVTTSGGRALLTNPTTCGAHTATSTIAPTSGGPAATPTANLNVTNCPAGGTRPFSPTFGLGLSTTQSGAHPVATFSITRSTDQQDLKSVAVSLPTGFVGSLAAVPLCAQADAAQGSCPAASQVGIITTRVGSGSELLTLPGEVFLTEGANGDIGALALRIPAKAGPYDLGLVNVVGRVVLRPDLGLDATFDNIPTQVKGVPVALRNMDLVLQGDINNGAGSYMLSNSTSCAAQTINVAFGSYESAAATATTPYQSTGCDSRSFNPAIGVSSTANSSDGTGTLPNYRISVTSPPESANISAVHVVLPKSINVNIQSLLDVCQTEAFDAGTCAPATARGSITLKTPLLPYAIGGTAYLLQAAPGNVLPRLGLTIDAPVNLKLVGVNKFVNQDQIDSSFPSIPDLAFSEMAIDFPGGPKGLLIKTKATTCGNLNADFASHSGQTATASAEVTGTCLSAKMLAQCQKPTLTASGRSSRSATRAKFAFSYRLADGCPAIRSLKLTLPKGSRINKSAAAKHLTGKYGNSKLKPKNFKIRGRVITVRGLPSKGASKLTIAGTRGAVRLPVCLKTRKACAKRKLSFAAVVTRSDSVTVKSTYKPAASVARFR